MTRAGANRNRLADWVNAEMIDFSSGVTLHVPALREYVNGSSLPAFVPLHWKHRPFSRRHLEQTLEFSGNPEAGRRPAGYQDAAVLLARKEVFDKSQKDYSDYISGVAQAVAFFIGREALIGILPADHQLPVVEQPDGSYYEVKMRIGSGTLRAAIGPHVPGLGLIVREDSLVNGGRMPVASIEAPDLLL